MLESHLTKIREQLLLMSSIAERSVSMALRALVERDEQLADAVEIEDNQLDELEVHIDEMVVTYMATHGPVATDCRFMLTATKISSNLERVGDEATTIARQARALICEPQLKPYIDIPLMAETAQEMLREAIDLFIKGNADTAQEIIARDKTVDDANKALAKELAGMMAADPKNISRCLHLMRVARSIERIADHASNIAEEVFYLFKAKDIRHDHSLHSGN